MSKISFIIPYFRSLRTIISCIHSISQQSISDNIGEILIIENGEKSLSLKDLGEITAKVRIVYEEKKGRSSARNRGIKESRFELCAFIDADVELDPKWLESCLSSIETYRCDIVSSYLRKKGEGLLKRVRSWNKEFLFKSYLLTLNSSALLAKKSVFTKFGNFDESYIRVEDTELSLRLLSKSVRIHIITNNKLGAVTWDNGILRYITLRRFVTSFYYTKLLSQYGLPFRNHEFKLESFDPATLLLTLSHFLGVNVGKLYFKNQIPVFEDRNYFYRVDDYFVCYNFKKQKILKLSKTRSSTLEEIIFSE